MIMLHNMRHIRYVCDLKYAINATIVVLMTIVALMIFDFYQEALRYLKQFLKRFKLTCGTINQIFHYKTHKYPLYDIRWLNCSIYSAFKMCQVTDVAHKYATYVA